MSTESPFKVALRDLPAHRRVVASPAYVDELVRGMPLRDALEEVPTDDGGAAELDLDSDGTSIFVQGTVTGQVTVACSRCVAATPIRFAEEVRVTFMPAAQVPGDDDDRAVPGAHGDKSHGKHGDKAHGDKAADGAAAGKAGHGVDKAHAAKPGHGDKAHPGKAHAHADKPRTKADEDDGVELATDDLDVFPYGGDVIDLEPLIREQFVLAVPFAPLCKDDCLGLCPQCGVDRNVTACVCEKPIDPRFAALQGLKLPS